MTNSRICILVDSLSYGGAEKSAATFSKQLDNAGFSAYIISFQDKITYDYCGNLMNIGAGLSSIKLIRQVQKLVRLRKSIATVRPACVVDFRIRNRAIQEFVLYAFVLRHYRVIYTMHSFLIGYHLPKGGFFKRVYNKNIVVAVSRAIKKELETNYGLNHVHHIPNAIDPLVFEKGNFKTKIKENYIIAIGRLDNKVKQFDKLIMVYSQSILPKHEIKLKILGDGPDKFMLEQLIVSLHMQDYVELIGFISKPYPHIRNAKFLVLCSKHEGMPMVILEALAMQTPVVSFNCKSGPSDMIKHNLNGILVNDQDFDSLKDVLDHLVANPEIITKMKKHTNTDLEDYYSEKHFKYWKTILE